ncbi:MAG: FkbM family methyltransferase [Alphaproteobacteria bacterium]
MAFDRDADGPLVRIATHDVVLGGVDSTPRDIAMFDALAGLLPAGIEPWNFRLARDVVTRFAFPHMRPDLKPGGRRGAAGLDGFHGQHKDAIADLTDPHVREQLMHAFAPKPGDVVLDCGSFLGFGALRMAQDAPGGRVIAVEASRACFARLESNVARNASGGVVARHAAIWSTEETRALNVTAAQANSLIAEIQDSDRAEPTPTATVDGLVRDHGLQRLDMLSLTLNGAEVEALAGATATLRDLRPRVRAAGWYRRDGRLIAEIVKPVLQRAGYTVHVGPHGNVLAVPEGSR